MVNDRCNWAVLPSSPPSARPSSPRRVRRRKKVTPAAPRYWPTWPTTPGNAPCICVQGKNQHTGSHKACHRRFDPVERFHKESGKPFTYEKAQEAAAASAGGAMDPPRDLSDKEQACVAAQLDAYHTQAPPDGPGSTPNSPLKATGARGKVNVDYEAYKSKVSSAAGD